MSSHLKQLEARIAELDKLAAEVARLGGFLAEGKFVEDYSSTRPYRLGQQRPHFGGHHGLQVVDQLGLR